MQDAPIVLMAEHDPSKERIHILSGAMIVPADVLPPRWFMRAPLTRRIAHRPLAAIVADIEGATQPESQPEGR